MDFSRRDVAELYELREALEVYAVGKAAEHALRTSDLETIQRAVQEVLLLRDELEASGEPPSACGRNAAVHSNRSAVPHHGRTGGGKLADIRKSSPTRASC